MLGPAAEAILLGFLQGCAGILPISHSGHLALVRLLFRIEESAALSVAGHVGLLLATSWVLRDRVRAMLAQVLKGLLHPKRSFGTPRTPGGEDALVVVVASLPTAALTIALRPSASLWGTTPLGIGVGLSLTTLALLSTQWVGRTSVEFPSWRAGLLLGVGQGLAALVGLSRSGMTISMALWLGVQRQRAFELSLLMSLPLLAGVIVFELPSAIAGSGDVFVPALVKGTVALITAILALRVLRKAVMTSWFPWFALWVGPLAIATLAMARAWPGH